MKQKNRFSIILEMLMQTVALKNTTLATALTYDVSYISKWLGGQLPSAKTEKTVMRGIAHCVVYQGAQEGVQTMMQDYRVNNREELEEAIYDNLMAECTYARNVQKDSENGIAPKTSFFPKLDMRQYLERMRHPVLRRIKSLNIMAMMDLMAMDREYRMQFVRIENGTSTNRWNYPDVHFSMVIDLSSIRKDYVYDTVFLLNMLSDMSSLDFKLYGTHHAFGRAIFAVEDEFCISAMLTHTQKCLSVVVSEDEENANILYRSVESQCTRERMLVRPLQMDEMLVGNDYARSLISTNQRMLFGRITEHFLSRSLLEEIMGLLNGHLAERVDGNHLRWIYTLSVRRFQELPVRVMFHESALSQFIVDGKLDFYNLNVILTPRQRLAYIENLLETLRANENIQVRLIYGPLFPDFQYNANQCAYLSDGASYLRLAAENQPENRIFAVNTPEMYDVFNHFFEEVWNNHQQVVLSDRDMVLRYLDHIAQQAALIAQLEENKH